MTAEQALKEMREALDSDTLCFPIEKWADAIEADLKAKDAEIAAAVAARESQATAISQCIDRADKHLDDAGIPRSDNGILTWWYRVELACAEIAKLRGPIYAVRYGNYEPSEIVSLHRSRETAEAECEKRTEPGATMWEVEAWSITP